MGKELLVSAKQDEVKIALLKDGRLMEVHNESREKKFSHGDIFIGQVKKVAPSLNAAFINIGHEKDAFLHYHDLGVHILAAQQFYKSIKHQQLDVDVRKQLKFDHQSSIDKNGTMADVLSSGQFVVVQVTKEPISTKGPRLTSEISIPGRFLVLVPFSNKVSCSQKIALSKERQRLKSMVEQIKPEGYGVIIRTVAEGQDLTEIQSDLLELLDKWNQCIKNVRTQKIPSKGLGEMGRASSIVRDYFNDDFVKIYCDDIELVNEIRDYLRSIAPGKEGVLEYYQGMIPLFEKMDVERQIKQSFGKHVNFAHGGYLIVEHTEALHVIDVNSGTINLKNENQEQNALQVNLAAATEVARQLRLRDMGGIIVVDFIDMKKSENKKLLFDHLQDVMNEDRAKHKILPPSRFGLIQITRQRVRPEIGFITKESNPNLGGLVEAPIVVVKRIQNNISALTFSDKASFRIYVHVHPFIAAYLNQGLWSIKNQWRWQFKKYIKIVPRHAYKYLEYSITNDQSDVWEHYAN